MTTSERSGDGDGGSGLGRRQVLKMVGGTAVAVTAMSGTASAHRSKFFGCERVASDTDGDYAVVSVDDGYEGRTLENDGPREDVPWEWDAHVYVADDDEAIVGFLEEDVVKGDERANKGCWLCVNPNACAEDEYESAQEIRENIDPSTVGHCEGEINISVGCDPATEPASEDEPSPAAADGSVNESANADWDDESVMDQLRREMTSVFPDFLR